MGGQAGPAEYRSHRVDRQASGAGHKASPAPFTGRTEGRAEGRTEGRAEREARIIATMHKKGYTLEQIADVVEKPPREVQEILGKGEQE